MSTFTTPGPITATVQVAGARVRIRANDRADTVVAIEPVDAARSLDVKVAGRTKVEFAGGRLSVRTTVAGDRTGSVAITIDLPTGSDLIAYLAYSDVRTHGSLGECDLHMAKGRVQLDRVAALQANVAAGEVTISHIAETADIVGSPRELRIRQVEGVVRHEGSTGRVWIGHASADVEIRNAGGSVDIECAEGSVTATSANCPIRIGRMTRGVATLMNASGTIDLGISEGTVALVDARSTKGAVRNLLPAREEAPDPSGAPILHAGDAVTVHARTRHGDVIIRAATAEPPAPGAGAVGQGRSGGQRQFHQL